MSPVWLYVRLAVISLAAFFAFFGSPAVVVKPQHISWFTPITGFLFVVAFTFVVLLVNRLMEFRPYPAPTWKSNPFATEPTIAIAEFCGLFFAGLAIGLAASAARWGTIIIPIALSALAIAFGILTGVKLSGLLVRESTKKRIRGE